MAEKIELYQKNDHAWEKYKSDHGKTYPSKYHEDERHNLKHFNFFQMLIYAIVFLYHI